MIPSVVHVGAVQTTVCRCGVAEGWGFIVVVIPPVIVLVVWVCEFIPQPFVGLVEVGTVLVGGELRLQIPEVWYGLLI